MKLPQPTEVIYVQFIQAIILGIIQGLTEFIPVSSSGHLLFVEKMLGWNAETLTFDVALHLGSLVALIGYFWRDWISIFTSFGKHVIGRVPYGSAEKSSGSGRWFIPIVVASVPAAIAGLKFDSKIEAMRGTSWMLPAVASALVVFGIVMLLAERVGKKQREMGAMNYADYIIVGIAQAMALFPGVSRSGATISAGLFRNLDRAAAARFSFLLSTPVILGAGVMKLKDIAEQGLPPGEVLMFVVGFVAAAASGYLAIRFLMNYLQRGSLKVFAIYRFILAAVIIFAWLH